MPPRVPDVPSHHGTAPPRPPLPGRLHQRDVVLPDHGSPLPAANTSIMSFYQNFRWICHITQRCLLNNYCLSFPQSGCRPRGRVPPRVPDVPTHHGAAPPRAHSLAAYTSVMSFFQNFRQICHITQRCLLNNYCLSFAQSGCMDHEVECHPGFRMYLITPRCSPTASPTPWQPTPA